MYSVESWVAQNSNSSFSLLNFGTFFNLRLIHSPLLSALIPYYSDGPYFIVLNGLIFYFRRESFLSLVYSRLD